MNDSLPLLLHIVNLLGTVLYWSSHSGLWISQSGKPTLANSESRCILFYAKCFFLSPNRILCFLYLVSFHLFLYGSFLNVICQKSFSWPLKILVRSLIFFFHRLIIPNYNYILLMLSFRIFYHQKTIISLKVCTEAVLFRYTPSTMQVPDWISIYWTNK